MGRPGCVLPASPPGRRSRRGGRSGGALDAAVDSALRRCGLEPDCGCRRRLVRLAGGCGLCRPRRGPVPHGRILPARCRGRGRPDAQTSRVHRAGRHGWGEEAAQAGWLTGWKQESDGGTDAGPAGELMPFPTPGLTAYLSAGRLPGPDLAPAVTSPGNGDVRCCDDGYRNAAEFLRARLRISAAEARRRLTLAADCCRARAFAASRCRPRKRNSPLPSPPATSRHGPRPSSPLPWTGSGTSPTPRTPPGWSMPSPGRRSRTTPTS